MKLKKDEKCKFIKKQKTKIKKFKIQLYFKKYRTKKLKN